MTIKSSLLFAIIFSFLACESGEKKAPIAQAVITQKEENPTPQNFNSYWYSGKAEISSYDVKQSRYGEMRDAEVVLVFVTEPFSLSKQVKLDRPKEAGEDKVSVMKLNNVRKFNTGIYDYSILTSTFTPIDSKNHPLTLKSTTSIQEWCGQTYTQLNLDGDNYQFKQFSYFESDGDEEKTLKATLLEEDLMTRIRINNGALALGETSLIPSTIYSRFSHKNMQPETATISKKTIKNTLQYTITYTTIERTLTIDVENTFPYKIMKWTEDNGDDLITTATLKSSLHEPYWNQKSVADEAQRDALKLIK
ncbi:septum formation inhibitor Maf [Formosa sp. 3Alg 14/1]|uniref:septum formation inhibitor Maf n=1 Tax=Formosa sp. 3Alg 14/1 TaxID=3382190 RepID=UPI0039BE339D